RVAAPSANAAWRSAHCPQKSGRVEFKRWRLLHQSQQAPGLSGIACASVLIQIKHEQSLGTERLRDLVYGRVTTGYSASKVLVALETDGNDATITVKIAGVAAYGGKPDTSDSARLPCCPQRQRSPMGAPAELAAFWGVDTKEANALAVDFDGVSVNNGGNTHDAILRYRARYDGESEN
ncbi:MAG: hypothetical protein AB7E84_12955, partial [Xanthobacteraceae bacterium]